MFFSLLLLLVLVGARFASSSRGGGWLECADMIRTMRTEDTTARFRAELFQFFVGSSHLPKIKSTVSPHNFELTLVRVLGVPVFMEKRVLSKPSLNCAVKQSF